MISFLFNVVFYILVVSAVVTGNEVSETIVRVMSAFSFVVASVFFVLMTLLVRNAPESKREAISKSIDTNKAFYRPKVRIFDVALDLCAAVGVATFAPVFAAMYFMHVAMMQLLIDKLIHIKRGEWK